MFNPSPFLERTFDGNVHEAAAQPVSLPSFVDRPPKKRQRTTSPDTQNGRCSIAPLDASPSPSIDVWLRLALDRQQETGRLAKSLFQPSLIRAKIGEETKIFPVERDQAAFTVDNPLIQALRYLIRKRSVPCPLCAFYDWYHIVYTHKLKRRSHRAEAKDAQPWLDMFRNYQARGGGPGA
ncbi:hypothetical protein FDECE_17010 [Fusarium decemcellulare]|nr:hypothetical protein FDECE_17010 [Fusarium decemcellulare]